MKIVTDILPQKKDKKRVNVYLDGEFFCGLEKITVLTNNLQKGMEISEEFLFEILEESEYTAAFERASKYITSGSHTKVQVVSYLKNKGYEGRIIAKVISKLEEYGYIDDAQFAQTFVDLKKHNKGKRRLFLELKVKGVDEKTAEAITDQIEDEDENAYAVAKKYLKGKALDFELKSKCFRHLLSRGFTYDTAQGAVERIEREEKQ